MWWAVIRNGPLCISVIFSTTFGLIIQIGRNLSFIEIVITISTLKETSTFLSCKRNLFVGSLQKEISDDRLEHAVEKRITFIYFSYYNEFKPKLVHSIKYT